MSWPGSPRSCRSSSTIFSSEPARRLRTGTACWCAHRPAPARPSWASSPCTSRLAAGRKCFYTTPIKALSNQKHNDLVHRYGPSGSVCSPGISPSTATRRRRGDDHRSAAQHALCGFACTARTFLCRHGRGALPGRPDARRGVGGSDPAPARRGAAGQPVGDGEQRRGVRRLDPDRARRHHGGRRRAPPRPAVAARAWWASGCSTCSTTGVERRRSPAASCWSTRSCCATSPTAARPTGWPTGSREAGAGAASRPPEHLPAADAARRDRHARPRGAAARDHFRVLPRRLRRRGQAVPALVAAAHHRRGTGPHRRGDRPPVRRPGRSRPDRARTTTNGARDCCAGWPRTTPECCRCSATPSKSCSPRAW